MRKLSTDHEAGIATYVFILFGTSFMLYLFGFTSMWNAYSIINLTGDGSSIPLANEGLNLGVRFISMITDSLYALLITAGTGALILIAFAKFGGASTTLWQYIIPAILLVVLNIFVFPIDSISKELTIGGEIPISLFILLFFNLFYVLAVIEFIRGQPT